MSMWPQLFLWHTTTDRCWPGVLRLPSQLASGCRGVGMPEIWEKLTFRLICAISASARRIGFEKRIVWEILLAQRGSKTS